MAPRARAVRGVPRGATALVALALGALVGGCGAAAPSSAPLSPELVRAEPRVRPSASRHVESSESAEDREMQSVELSIDEGDEDSTGAACAAQRREAENACPDGSLLCLERARALRCQDEAVPGDAPRERRSR